MGENIIRDLLFQIEFKILLAEQSSANYLHGFNNDPVQIYTK